MKKIFTHSEANEIFKFRCILKWNQLHGKSPSDTERYCDNCRQNVYLCDNETELLEHAKQGHCVAIATEISPNQRLTYLNDNEMIDISMGLPCEGLISCDIEREDGAKAADMVCYDNIYYPQYWLFRRRQELLEEWHLTNEAFKAILIVEENQASCLNKERIYQLKALLAWVDEAIAAGLKWRFKKHQF